MANQNAISRRSFLGRSVIGLAVLGSGAAALEACGGGGDEAPNCASPSGLTAPQQQTRTSLQYVDRATDASKQCQKCNFYQAAQAANACGGCQLNLGPVSPLGTCISFAARA